MKKKQVQLLISAMIPLTVQSYAVLPAKTTHGGSSLSESGEGGVGGRAVGSSEPASAPPLILVER